MVTNTRCTLLLPQGTGHRLLTADALWEGAAGASLSNTGASPENGATVYIPFSSLPAGTALRATGREFIVRGVVENFSTLGELLKSREVFTLKRVTAFDYGSPELHHWKVEAL